MYSTLPSLLLSVPTPGAISSTYSIWIVFVNVSKTGTSALNFNCSSFSSWDLMLYGLMAEFWTCFDKPNVTIITNIYMQNDNYDFIWRKHTSYCVTVSIFLFQGCHLVILMLPLAQYYKNILRLLQPLSFTSCDRSFFNRYRHNQFIKVTVYVDDLCYLQMLWSSVVSCCMPSMISVLVYNLINVVIFAFVRVCCIWVTKFDPLWVIFSNLQVAVIVLLVYLPISTFST